MNDGPFIIRLILGFMFALAAIFFGVVGMSTISCAQTAEVMQRDSRFNIMTGCMIKTADGQWMPLENIRTVTP